MEIQKNYETTTHKDFKDMMSNRRNSPQPQIQRDLIDKNHQNKCEPSQKNKEIQKNRQNEIEQQLLSEQIIKNNQDKLNKMKQTMDQCDFEADDDDILATKRNSLYVNNHSKLYEDLPYNPHIANQKQQQKQNNQLQQQDTLYSSFSDMNEGIIQIDQKDIKVMPSQNYQGLLQNNAESEDILDTYEEFGLSNNKKKKEENKLSKELDHSLSKSQITMEDNNNKTQKQKQSNKEQNEIKSNQELGQLELNEEELSQQQSNDNKIFALKMDDDFHPETSFDTINSEHLFLTHQTEDNMQMGSSLSGTAQKQTQRQSRQHTEQNMGSSEMDESLIEIELKKITKNLNTFTVDHFNTLRQQIQRFGFHHAAQKAKKDFNLMTVDSTTTLMSVGGDDHIGISGLAIENNKFEVQLNNEKGEFNRNKQNEESKFQNQMQKLYSQNTTASKNLLKPNESNMIKVDFEDYEYAKSSQANYQQMMQQADPGFVKEMSGISPLIRKLIICEQILARNHPFIEVVHSASCSGFNTAPLLLYSDKEFESRAYIEKNNPKQLNQSNVGGQGGSFVLNQLLSPYILRSFVCTPVTWISCGFEHCLALTVFGTVASWGYGASGCLGHGNYVSYTAPKLIQSGDIIGKHISFIECGGYHNGALSNQGELFMWGRSDVGQLGLRKQDLSKDEMGLVSSVPKNVNRFGQSATIKQLSLGEAHTLVLDQNGQVYSFGWGELGQLGIDNSKKEKDFQIHRIKAFENMPCTKIAAGAVFSTALTKDSNRLYVWGSGQNGQLGLGSVKNSDYPVFVDFLDQEKVIDMVCGDSHVIALTQSGKVYGWGQGVSMSQSLINSLRESSQADTYNQLVDQHNKNFKQFESPTKKQNEQSLEVICFFPRLLCEVDIAHTFLIKKKALDQISSDQMKQQIDNVGQSMNSEDTIPTNRIQNSSQYLLSQNIQTMPNNNQVSKSIQPQYVSNGGRNYLPSNNTIFEVSEKDSEYDEKLKTIKRGQNLRNQILTTTASNQINQKITNQTQMLSESQQQNLNSVGRSVQIIDTGSMGSVGLGDDQANCFKSNDEEIKQVNEKEATAKFQQYFQQKQDDQEIVKRNIDNKVKKHNTILYSKGNNPNLNQTLTNSQIQGISNISIQMPQTVKQRVETAEIYKQLEEFTQSNLEEPKNYNNQRQRSPQLSNYFKQNNLAFQNTQKKFQTKRNYQGTQSPNSLIKDQAKRKTRPLTNQFQNNESTVINQSILNYGDSNNSSRMSVRDQNLNNNDSENSQTNNTVLSMTSKPTNKLNQRVKSPQPELSKINKLKNMTINQQNISRLGNTSPTQQLQRNQNVSQSKKSIQQQQSYSSILGNSASNVPQSTRNIKNLQLKISSLGSGNSQVNFSTNTSKKQLIQPNDQQKQNNFNHTQSVLIKDTQSKAKTTTGTHKKTQSINYPTQKQEKSNINSVFSTTKKSISGLGHTHNLNSTNKSSVKSLLSPSRQFLQQKNTSQVSNFMKDSTVSTGKQNTKFSNAITGTNYSNKTSPKGNSNLSKDNYRNNQQY